MKMRTLTLTNGKRNMVAFLFVVIFLASLCVRPSHAEAIVLEQMKCEIDQNQPLEHADCILLRVTFVDVYNRLKGNLVITVPEVDNNYFLYQQVVDLEENEFQHSYSFRIPVEYKSAGIRVDFYDEEGQIKETKTVYASFSDQSIEAPEAVKMLVVGYNPFLRPLSFEMVKDDTRFRIMASFALEDSLNFWPDFWAYDIIAMRQSAYSKLSEEKLMLVRDWLGSGGILLVSGVRVMAEPNAYQPLFQGYEVMASTTKDEVRAAYVGEGAVVFHKKEYISGLIIRDTQLMSMMEEASVVLPHRMLSDHRVKMTDDVVLGDIKESLLTWRFSLPTLKLYVYVLAFYVFVALPGVYIFLRGIQKRYYMRGTLIMVASVFGILIYILGANSRMNQNYVTSLGITDYSDDWGTYQAFVAVQTGDGQAQELIIPNGYNIMPYLKQGEGSPLGQKTAASGDCNFVISRYLSMNMCRIGNQRFGTNYIYVQKSFWPETFERDRLSKGLVLAENGEIWVVEEEVANVTAYQDPTYRNIAMKTRYFGTVYEYLLDEATDLTPQQRKLYMDYLSHHLERLQGKGTLFIGFSKSNDPRWLHNTKDCQKTEYGLVFRILK